MHKMTRRKAIGGALLTGLCTLAPKFANAQQDAQHGPPVQPAAARSQPGATGVRRVIVDTDPGNDDALALLLALHAPALQVEAVTVCPGNLGPDYEQQVKNALFLVDLAGKTGKVPVFAGMSHPILNKPYPVATFIHGKYGLGSFEVPALSERPQSEHAVDAMRRIVRASPDEITLLALGGLTNIAMAMLRDPDFAQAVKGIVFVGGRYASPGLPPSYNVLVDPEAAHVVFTSGVPITLVGADVINRDSVLRDEDFDIIAKFNTKLSRFFVQSNDLRRTFEKAHRGTTGSTNPDPMAVATAINPALARLYQPIFVQVELEGELTRGLLVYGNDIYSGRPTPPPNADICLQASPEVFREMVFSTLRSG
jgi:inosine-uridine nucleoside N-ribohydrolase